MPTAMGVLYDTSLSVKECMEIQGVRRSAHLDGGLARGNAGRGSLIDGGGLLAVVGHDDEDDEGVPDDDWRGSFAESNACTRILQIP